MKFINHVSIERLRALLYYDPDTGDVYWRKRAGDSKIIRLLNARDAGHKAGYLTNSGYIGIGIDGYEYHIHRVIWALVTGEWPDREVDHINWQRADNRWVNLRLATHAQNGTHSGPPKSNTSGCKGVSYRNDCGRWRVSLRQDGKFYSGGNFDAFDDAVRAYWKLARGLRGEFAGY